MVTSPIMRTDNSHHRFLCGHLPHYYVTKRDDRLTRQEKPISIHGGSVRSVLGYIVVEELATGGAYVQLAARTTSEHGQSVLFALTQAWSGGKREPMLTPIGVPSTLWVSAEMMEEPEDWCHRYPADLAEICKAVGVQLKRYGDGTSFFAPIRPQQVLEHLIEHAIAGSLDYRTAHNHPFSTYADELDHCCSVWLGLHASVRGSVYRRGTPVDFDDDMVIATRKLPTDWYERAGKLFKEPKRTEADWKKLRETFFWTDDL